MMLFAFNISSRRSRCRCRRSSNIGSMSCINSIGFIHTWIGIGWWCGDAFIGTRTIATAGRSFVWWSSCICIGRNRIAYGIFGTGTTDEFGNAAGAVSCRLDQSAFSHIFYMLRVSVGRTLICRFRFLFKTHAIFVLDLRASYGIEQMEISFIRFD